MTRCAVVLCAFNGAQWLDAQLDSLLTQTRLPDVLVCADDLSTDDTHARLLDWAPRFEARGCHVVVRRNTANLGYVRNFESAFASTDADLVFPCDQDDVWYPDKIQRMAAIFEADPDLDVLHADGDLIDADARPMGRRLFETLEYDAAEQARMHAGDGFEVLLRRNTVTGAAMAFRRRVLEHARPFPVHWAHDEWLAIVAAITGKVDVLAQPVFAYRQHGGNQIGVRPRSATARYTGFAGYRKSFLARQALRQQELSAAARQHAWPTDIVLQLQAREQHAQVRARLKPTLLQRVPQVLHEVRSGRYHRFGKGLRSALVDVLDLD